MGQAKRGGTREQRVALAIERDKKIAEEREKRMAEWWYRLTPEERQSVRIKKRKDTRHNSALRDLLREALGAPPYDNFWGPPRLKREI